MKDLDMIQIPFEMDLIHYVNEYDEERIQFDKTFSSLAIIMINERIRVSSF